MSRRAEIAKWLRTQIRVGKIGPNSAEIIARDEDAAFIAHARTALPELLERAEAAEATIERVREVADSYEDKAWSDEIYDALETR